MLTRHDTAFAFLLLIQFQIARKQSTVFEPFVLESDRLHEKFLADQAARLAAEEAERVAAASFHAAPVPVTVLAGAAVPKPRPAPRPPTEPANVVLASDVRAQERVRFEAERRARLAEAEKAAQENAKRREVCVCEGVPACVRRRSLL